MSQTVATDKTEWTIMGFLAGDNNLNEEMVLTLQEILAAQERHGRLLWPRVKILAQLDPSGLGLPVQRYVFDTAKSDADDTNKHRLETYEIPPSVTSADYLQDVNTGNPEALSGFVKWSVEEGPHKEAASADRYMLILSGHGSGTTEDFLLRDEAPADSLTVPELEEALLRAREFLYGDGMREDQKIHVLGMDCCFMSMVEVFYQVRNHAEIVVAAESMIPDFGWPYHRILAKAEDTRDTLKRALEPEELAEIIVGEFIEHYSDYDRTAGRSVDLAWIKLSGMDDLKNAISDLGGALLKALEHRRCLEKIVWVHWRAQTYKFDQFVDIRDFCDVAIEGFKDLAESQDSDGEKAAAENVITKCEEVIATLGACVGRSGCSGFAYQHSYGLSVYFPWACVFDSYKFEEATQSCKCFEWAENNEWVDFLKKYVEKTRREPRRDMKDASRTDERQRKAIDHAIDALIRGVGPDDLNRPRRIVRGLLKTVARVTGTGGFDDAAEGSRYHKSRYHKSRYHKSRYHKSRWPGDREKSVKNFTPVVGIAFSPKRPD